MAGIFIVLFFVSLGLFLWGIVHPNSLSSIIYYEFSRKKAGLVFGLSSLVLFVLIGFTASSSVEQSASQATLTTHPTAAVRAKAALSVPQPVVTTSQVSETQPIPFKTVTKDDNTLPKGQTKTIQVGQAGTDTLTYEVTYTDGKETNRQLLSQVTTLQPVDEIIADGTYVAPALIPTPPASQPIPRPMPSGCYPLTNGGNCYEPGEYCRVSDRGASGLAGDGEMIICTNNNGWRWEPK